MAHRNEAHKIEVDVRRLEKRFGELHKSNEIFSYLNSRSGKKLRSSLVCQSDEKQLLFGADAGRCLQFVSFASLQK